jgi:hypothetical protein
MFFRACPHCIRQPDQFKAFKRLFPLEFFSMILLAQRKGRMPRRRPVTPGRFPTLQTG